MAPLDQYLVGPQGSSSPEASPVTASTDRATTPTPPDLEAPHATPTQAGIHEETAVQPAPQAMSSLAEVSTQAAGRSLVRAAPPAAEADELAAGGKAPHTAQAHHPPRPTPVNPQHSGEYPARCRRPRAATSMRCTSRIDRYPWSDNALVPRGLELPPDCRKYRDQLIADSRAPPSVTPFVTLPNALP